MRKYILAFVVILGLLPKYCTAQQSKEQKLSKFIENTLKIFPVIPSISIAVADDKKTLFAKGFGFYDVENNLKSNSNTNYYIASTTKSFVGLLALILEEEGKIHLNAQITSYKPFKNFANKEIFKNITVLDLLSHQSGINNSFISIPLAYSGDYNSKNILILIDEITTKNKKGKKFDYTNFGYYLYSLILKEELGLNWKDLLREKIFNPIEMYNTTAYISKSREMALPYGTLFKDKVKKLYLQKTDETMHAAGGIISTANDMANFLSFCINDGVFKNKQTVKKGLIKKSYLKQTSAKHKAIKVFNGNGYGIGWRLGKFNKKEVVYHFGSYTGFYSHFSFLPKEKIGVSVFINHELGLPIANLIANYAYDLYLGNNSKLKKHERTLKNKMPKLLKRAQKSQLAHEKKLAARTWQLTMPKENYAGIYKNEKFGTVKVTFKNNKNYVKFGNLEAECTPYPEQDSMRVELIPNSGSVIQFIVKSNKVTTIAFGKIKFKKIV